MRIGFQEISYTVGESAGILEIVVKILADKSGNSPDIGLLLGARVTSRDRSAVGKVLILLTESYNIKNFMSLY